QAEQQDDRQRYANRLTRNRGKISEVERDHHCNECPQHKNELALRDEIRLTGFVNQFRYLAHRTVNRKVLQLDVDRKTEQQAAKTEQQSDHQQGVSVQAQKVHRMQVG